MNENSLKNLEKGNRFAKGESGNKRGRPKKEVIVRRRFAKYLGLDPKELGEYDVNDMKDAVRLALDMDERQLSKLKKSKTSSLGDQAAIAIAEKVRTSGDVKVWADVYEMLTGKKLLDNKQSVELSTTPGSAFTIVLKDPKDEELFKDDENF